MIKYCHIYDSIAIILIGTVYICHVYDTRSKNTKQYQTFKDIAPTNLYVDISVVESGRFACYRGRRTPFANFEQWQRGAPPVTQVHGDMHTNRRGARKMWWHESFFIAASLSVNGNKSILRWALSLAGETDSHSGCPRIQ